MTSPAANPVPGAAPGGYRSYAGDDLVTGEGVEVELPVAGLLSRAASGGIDLLVTVGLLVGGGFLFAFLTARTSDAVLQASSIVLIVGVTVLVPAVVETLTRGRSLGKLALGLRVVRDDGGPVTFRHSLTRALVGFPEIYLSFGSVAFIAGLVSPRVKRLGDMVAGTYVVAQRSHLRLTPPPQMPVGLEGWARTADIAVLPTGLALGIRQFLGRAGGLTPQSREALGRSLLAEVLPRVSPPPPPFAHPEAVLAAVVAERRRRDLVRLDRDDQRRARVLPRDPLG